MTDLITREIPLTKGMVAIVDGEDYEFLMQWKWRYHNLGYAIRTMRPTENPARPTVFMHRVINNTPDGMDTDHINGNKLDNRKGNLRTVTAAQNKHNRSKYKTNKSGYKGVCWIKGKDKWRAQLSIHGKQTILGEFLDIKDAIAAHQQAVSEYHGGFAYPESQ